MLEMEERTELSQSSETAESINLTLWEGSTSSSHKVESGSEAKHIINKSIPAGKIVVVSVIPKTTGSTVPDKIRVYLYKGSTPIDGVSGGFAESKMTYFKTTASGTYSAVVKNTTNDPFEYNLRVAVVNCIPRFIPADSAGIAETATDTYMFSNVPEAVSTTANTGDSGRYLARGKLRGRARLYFEHMNWLSTAMHFGVLLWNKDPSNDIYVTLDNRSFRAAPAGDMNSVETAMTMVWQDCFNAVKNSDLSDLPRNQTLVIPKYSASNPSASAKWVYLSQVPAPSGSASTRGIFNGVLSVQLKKADGSLYTGSSLFCDTYLMSVGKKSQVASNVAQAQPVPAPRNQYSTTLQRGSGSGCVLAALMTNTIEITRENPYNFLITGYDPPLLQTGESMTLTNYTSSGTVDDTDRGVNYGVEYRFVFSNLSCNGQINARIKCNTKTNPSAVTNIWTGLYVAGYVLGKQPFRKLIVGQDVYYDFALNLPKGQQVVINLVVSGMSSLPLEVSLYTP